MNQVDEDQRVKVLIQGSKFDGKVGLVQHTDDGPGFDAYVVFPDGEAGWFYKNELVDP